MTHEEKQALRLKIAQQVNEACEGSWAAMAGAHMLTSAASFDAELNDRKTIKTVKLIGGESFALMGASLHGEEVVLKMAPKDAASYRMIDVPIDEADSFLGLEDRLQKVEKGEVVAAIQKLQIIERRERLEEVKKDAAKREAADRRKRSARYGDNFGSW